MKRQDSMSQSGVPAIALDSLNRYMKGKVPPVYIDLRSVSEGFGLSDNETGVVGAIGIRVEKKIDGAWKALIVQFWLDPITEMMTGWKATLALMDVPEGTSLTHPPVESRADLLLKAVLVPCDCGSPTCIGESVGIVHAIRKHADGKWRSVVAMMNLMGGVGHELIGVDQLTPVGLKGAAK